MTSSLGFCFKVPCIPTPNTQFSPQVTNTSRDDEIVQSTGRDCWAVGVMHNQRSRAFCATYLVHTSRKHPTGNSESASTAAGRRQGLVTLRSAQGPEHSAGRRAAWAGAGQLQYLLFARQTPSNTVKAPQTLFR